MVERVDPYRIETPNVKVLTRHVWRGFPAVCEVALSPSRTHKPSCSFSLGSYLLWCASPPRSAAPGGSRTARRYGDRSNPQFDSSEFVLDMHVYWVPEGDSVLTSGNTSTLYESDKVMLDTGAGRCDSVQ